MTAPVVPLYLSTFLIALGLGLVLTPLFRRFALRWNILDHPSTPVKTHRMPTPYLGGVALFLAVASTLLLIRFLTDFPSGTLRALRGMLIGGAFMVAVGLVDDIKKGGLGFQWKFVFQILGALLLIAFDIRIKFIDPPWLASLITVLWVVGITNAFNIIDIMDGLSSSQALVASLGFLFIAVPTEDIYVNFAAAAVAGACLGFLPYNMSARFKIFMGDAGSLLLGFLMAALSLGMSYTKVNDIGVLAPLLILGLPLYDTFFVSVLRIQQGKSPFLGSKDHLALKLAALGLSRRNVVWIMAAAAAVCSLTAYMVSWSPFFVALFVIGLLSIVGFYLVLRLQKVHVP